MSVLTIWNLALSHLGDDATVDSPNEQSVVAELCRQFYATARDTTLELHPWNFATRRGPLALLTEQPFRAWAYAYAMPADALSVWQVGRDQVSVLTDHTGAALRLPETTFDVAASGEAEDFEIEVREDGTTIILSNVAEAFGRWTRRVEDSTKFSPSFRMALSYLLASQLAGPILKGDAGRAESRRLLQEFRAWLNTAGTSDANQHRAVRVRQNHEPDWMRAR